MSTTFITDYSFLCGLRNYFQGYSEVNSIFFYQFDHTPCDGSTLVYHGSEVPYVFDGCGDGNPDDETFAEALGTYWSNLAKTGNPNKMQNLKLTSNLADWPMYSSADPKLLVLVNNFYAEQGYRDEQCDWWDTWYFV